MNTARALDVPALVEELLRHRRQHVVVGQLVDTCGGPAVVERIGKDRRTGRIVVDARTGDGKLYFFDWE